MIVSRQAFYGFVQHDDWDYLTRPGAPVANYTTPWSQTLTNGRWINWLWYFVSQHLSSISASIIFVMLYAAVCWRASAMLAESRRGSLFLAVPLFFSPMAAVLSLWPATLIPSISIVLLGVLLLTSRPASRLDLVVLSLSFFGCVLAYPPLGEILVLVFALKHRRQSWRFLGNAAACVLASYAAAVLVIFTINWFVHGYFGVRISAWRDPHPLRSLADLRSNFQTYWSVWSAAWVAMPLALAASACAAVVAFAEPAVRRSAMVGVLTAAFLVCIDMGIGMLSGVRIPEYSMVWLWVAMCAFPGMLLSSRIPYARLCASAVLLIDLYVGVPVWWQHYHSGAETMMNVSRVAQQILRQVSAEATRQHPVIVAGDPQADPKFSQLFPNAIDLGMILWDDFGIRSQRCTASLCRRIENSANQEMVSTIGGQVVLRFPGHAT